MPDRDKDELADALAKLASGDAPSVPDGFATDGIPSEQVPLTPRQDRPARPAAPGVGGGARPASPAPRIIQPPAGAKALGSPSSTNTTAGQRPRPMPAPVPKASVPKASAPSAAPKSPAPSRPARPAAPTRREAPEPARTAPAMSNRAEPAPSFASAEDDDTVSVPAPDASAFKHRPAPPKPKRVALFASMGFRRTIIPILLTMGVALPACAVWWLMLDPDSPLKSMSVAYPITLACIGIVMLALAVLNMLQVKAQLASV